METKKNIIIKRYAVTFIIFCITIIYVSAYGMDNDTNKKLLLDKELKKAGINGEKLEGYTREVSRHLDVGLEILSGRADAGPAIRAVAKLLDLDFIPLRWERFDLMISKERFFEEGIQRFLGILHETGFQQIVTREFAGYDVSSSGQMVFPQATEDPASP